jgi:hypothetical protein
MSTSISAKRFNVAHLSALKPGATRRDFSDSAVAGLVLRVLTTGTKSWLFEVHLERQGYSPVSRDLPHHRARRGAAVGCQEPRVA